MLQLCVASQRQYRQARLVPKVPLYRIGSCHKCIRLSLGAVKETSSIVVDPFKVWITQTEPKKQHGAPIDAGM